MPAATTRAHRKKTDAKTSVKRNTTPKPSAKPKPPAAKGAPQKARPADKHADYSNVPLFLWFPPGDDRTFLAGVLRKTYKAHVNTAAGFIRQKLHPVASEGGELWQPTAEGHDIVLPPFANDADRDILALAQRFDAAALPHKQSLLVYLTLRFPRDASLQRGWELGRAFALRNLALKRGLATVIVQHAPHRMGSPNPPHLHLMILPRTLTSLGFGVFDDSVTNDAGLEQLYGEWITFTRRWI